MTRPSASRLARTTRSRPAARRARNAIPLDALPGAVVIVERAGAVSFLNAEAERLTGWTQADLRGRLVVELFEKFPPAALSRSAALGDWMDRMRPRKAGWAAQLLHRRGRRIPVRLQIRPLRGARGQVTGLVIGLQRSGPVAGHPQRTGTLVSLLRGDATFRALFEGTAIGMALVRHTGRFLQVNQALCAITGYTRTELQQRTFQSLTHPEDLTDSLDRCEHILRGEPNEHWEKRYIHKLGHVVWVHLSVAPLRDAAGRVRYFLSGFQDITALKSISENLRENEELFRSAFDASAIGMGLVSLEGRYLRVNQALCQFLGQTVDALLGSDISEFNDPEEYATIVARRAQMIAGSIPRFFSYEKRFRHSSGSVLWGQLTVALVRNAAGQPTSFCVMVQDTTERHLAEQALRESEQRLRAMVEGLPVLMDAFDDQGIILAWNKECERVTGYSAEEIVNNPQAMELLYPDSAYRSAMFEDAHKYRHMAYRGREWTLRCKDGSTKTIAWNNVGAHVQIPGWDEWGVGIDVTERRRLEVALQQAGEYEKRRLGQEMHDGLGQELAALALLAHSLALSTDLSTQTLQPELQRLARIASNAVSSGRAIAHGLAPLEDKEGALLQALRELANQPLTEVGGTEVSLTEECSAELAIPPPARSHLYRMAQEALHNAIRHSRARTVTMTFTVNPKLVRLRVSDDGRGIPAAARRAAGMGMKTMHDRAMAIGGSVAVKTRAGAGTSIIIECPNLMASSEPGSFV